MISSQNLATGITTQLLRGLDASATVKTTPNGISLKLDNGKLLNLNGQFSPEETAKINKIAATTYGPNAGSLRPTEYIATSLEKLLASKGITHATITEEIIPVAVSAVVVAPAVTTAPASAPTRLTKISFPVVATSQNADVNVQLDSAPITRTDLVRAVTETLAPVKELLTDLKEKLAPAATRFIKGLGRFLSKAKEKFENRPSFQFATSARTAVFGVLIASFGAQSVGYAANPNNSSRPAPASAPGKKEDKDTKKVVTQGKVTAGDLIRYAFKKAGGNNDRYAAKADIFLDKYFKTSLDELGKNRNSDVTELVRNASSKATPKTKADTESYANEVLESRKIIEVITVERAKEVAIPKATIVVETVEAQNKVLKVLSLRLAGCNIKGSDVGPAYEVARQLINATDDQSGLDKVDTVFTDAEKTTKVDSLVDQLAKDMVEKKIFTVEGLRDRAKELGIKIKYQQPKKVEHKSAHIQAPVKKAVEQTKTQPAQAKVPVKYATDQAKPKTAPVKQAIEKSSKQKITPAAKAPVKQQTAAIKKKGTSGVLLDPIVTEDFNRAMKGPLGWFGLRTTVKTAVTYDARSGQPKFLHDGDTLYYNKDGKTWAKANTRTSDTVRSEAEFLKSIVKSKVR